jgi:ribosomal-protein-alanine N-acetyltransferase
MATPPVRLERLRAEHAPALLVFDRGDAYFAGFAARHQALLAEQDAGACHFHVVLDEHGELIGRVNLVDVTDGVAELGYRVAEKAAGRGVARAAVTEVCRLAAGPYGLAALTAVTTLDNPASRAVLERTGFTVTAQATIGHRPGVRYRRPLPAPDAHGRLARRTPDPA